MSAASENARSARASEQKTLLGVVYKMVGRAGVKWVILALGTGLLWLTWFGIQLIVRSEAVAAPEFVAYKSDVDTLKVAVGKLTTTADQHTEQLKQYGDALKHAADVQSKIFDKLNVVVDKIGAVDVHVAAVGQQVTDQAVQIERLNQKR